MHSPNVTFMPFRKKKQPSQTSGPVLSAAHAQLALSHGNAKLLSSELLVYLMACVTTKGVLSGLSPIKN